MTKISAKEVNELRKVTGAGMMDCKNALVEASGNREKAIEILRKKGQKIAAKRADRDSSEGVVIALINEMKTKGVIISLNCETDFVAKNNSFIDLAEIIVNKALNLTDKDALLKTSFDGNLTIEEKLVEQTGVIGEKIELTNFEYLEGSYVQSYIHTGNKIASLVSMSKNIDGIHDLSKDICMQVAAMSPVALNPEEVDQSIIEKEIEIEKEKLLKEGKPEAMLDKIVKGKLNRFFKDNTLIKQDFIKENKISVEVYVKSLDKSLEIKAFRRVSID